MTAPTRPTPESGAPSALAARSWRAGALIVGFLLLAVGTGTDLEGLSAAVAEGSGAMNRVTGDAAIPAGDARREDAGCLPEQAPRGAWVQLPDGHGGAIYQLAQPDPATDPEHIWWERADGPGGVLVEADTDSAVRPYASVGGDEAALWFTTRERGVGPTDDIVSLYRLDFRSGRRDLIVHGIGGFEVEPLAVSVSSGGLLVSNADSTGSWFELYDSFGDPIDWPANPHPVDDYTHKTVYGALSPDGGTIASIEAVADEPWSLVIRARDTAEVLSTEPVVLPELRRVMWVATSASGFEFAAEADGGALVCVYVPWDFGPVR